MAKTAGIKYFVIVAKSDYKGAGIAPLVDLDNEMNLFDSEHEAELAAMENKLACAFGYEVYPWTQYEYKTKPR